MDEKEHKLKTKYNIEDIQKNREYVSVLRPDIRKEFKCQVKGCNNHACWIDGMKDTREHILLCFDHNENISRI